MSSPPAPLLRSTRPVVAGLAVAVTLGFGMIAGLPPLRLVALCAVVAAGRSATGMSLDWSPLPVTPEGNGTPRAGAHIRRLRGWSLALTFISVALAILLGPWPTLTMIGLLAWSWAYSLRLHPFLPAVLLDVIWFAVVPILVSLAHPHTALPPWWQLAVGAALGAAAHILSARLRRRAPDR